MQLVLDTGFIISLLLLMLGLERLLLRPRQRERLHSYFEELTVKVDDLSSDTIITQLGSAETIMLLSFVTYFWFCVIIVVTLLLSAIIDKTLFSLVAIREMQLARTFICGISLLLLSRWPAPQIILRFFGNSPSLKRLSIIATIVFFAGSIILLTTTLLSQWLLLGHIQIIQPAALSPWTATGLLELAFWPAYVLIWLLVAPLTLGILAFNRPDQVRLIIKPVVGSLWRLVEYEKGAFSALILVVAVILGALKLLYVK